MVKSFVLGLVGGGVLAWWFKDSIAADVDARTREVRAAAAARLRAAADAIAGGLAGSTSNAAVPADAPHKEAPAPITRLSR